MKKCVVLVVLCLVLSSLTVCAAEYKAEYRLSTVLGPAFPWGRAAERWANLVREKTEGRINIKVYPGTSLVGGDQTKEFTAIRQGVIDLAVGSSINWSPQIKQLNLFSLPFLTPDEKAFDALINGPVAEDLFAILDKQGVVPLAIGENGFRELSNSKQPIASPADLKGLKIRVVGSPIFIDGFTALGANPTQMSWADAQPALATKAVDGQENPLSVFNAAKLHTVEQKYLTLWGYMADPLFFVVSKTVWAQWSEGDRAVVAEAAKQAAAENLVDARKGITPEDDALLKEIEQNGVTITRLTDEQRKPFREATRPVFDKWAEIVGKDLVKKAEDAIAASR
ncbi:DctP family TRAP transporter solute-binding subunit [Desulfomicrobium salsuginis]